jgi:hypothetical protein
MKILTDQTAALLLAQAVVACTDAREASFDKAAADATAANEMFDYKQFYKLSLRDACKLAGHLEEPVFLMLYTAWNDAYEWAVQVIEKEVA